MAMAVDSRRVQGRRKLHFASFDEVLIDAGNLVASPNIKTLGNWPLPQLLTHLAIAINNSIDGISTKGPLIVRMIAPLIKKRVMSRGVPAGYKLPSSRQDALFPAAESADQALQIYTLAIQRTGKEKMKSIHPIFGQISHEEWAQFHLRHAELHLSFVVIEK